MSTFFFIIIIITVKMFRLCNRKKKYQKLLLLLYLQDFKNIILGQRVRMKKNERQKKKNFFPRNF